MSEEIEALGNFFFHSNLPDHYSRLFMPFGELAVAIVAGLPPNPERAAAVRKLLEAQTLAISSVVRWPAGPTL